MLNKIYKYKVSILWTLSVTIIITGIIIAQFKPFSDKGSGILMWFSFNSALLAILFYDLKKNNRYKTVFCIAGMVYITYKLILRFI